MRPSKRTAILEAALRLIRREGIAALSFEAIAEEASLTRSGIVYHFPTHEALLDGLHEHFAASWEAELVACSGPADTLDPAQRAAAYARTAATSADGAELQLILEASAEQSHQTPWNEVVRTWAPEVPAEGPLSAEQARGIIARLAADGLWLYNAITGTPMAPEVRAQLGEMIARLAEGTDDGTEQP